MDMLARYGGDEFVVLMPETSPEGGRIVAERLRQAAMGVPVLDHRQITISCGVAGWLGTAEDTAMSVLTRADAALYEAKQNGRNRVVVCEAEAVRA